jgi:hypothetical protein
MEVQVRGLDGRGYGACGIKFPYKSATAFGRTLIYG